MSVAELADRRRKRTHAVEGDAQPASVQLHYLNLPPESRQQLDAALRSWADWHVAKYPVGYVPPSLLSGSLSYAPGAMEVGPGAAPVMEDVPSAPERSGAATMWFNISYERVGDVPQYDRSTDAQLHFSTRKRPAASALAAADAAAASAAGRPVKRLRNSGRCFNCGSYAHSLRDCWKELDRQLVEESKREQAERSGAAYRSAAKRYYLQGAEGGSERNPAEQTPGEFAGLEPGQLSEGLRRALGIGPLAPPPWLHRMRELGMPPGYLTEAGQPPAANGGAAAAAKAVGTAEADGAAAAGEASAALGGSNAPAAASAAAGSQAETSAARRQAADELLEDFIPLGGGSSSASSDAEEDGDAAPAQLECCVQYPGLNAPLPEGADEHAYAPRQQQHQQAAAAALLPPGFGTPGSMGGTPATSGRQHPLGSADRSHSAGRWAPLRGLHPSQHAASEGSAPAAAGGQGQHQGGPTPPRPLHHGTSAPALYVAHQQAPPLPPDEPPARRPMPSYEPPPPLPGYQPAAAAAAGGGGQMLPPGFGGAAQQLAYGHQQQQQHQQQQGSAREDVYSVSRADPGHMLVFDQRGAAASAAAAAAAPQQYQQYPGAAAAQGWGGAYGGMLPQGSAYQAGGAVDGQGGHASGAWGQQQGSGGYWAAQQAGGGQWAQQQPGGGATQAPAPQPDPQAAAAYQQRLWQSSGRGY